MIDLGLLCWQSFPETRKKSTIAGASLQTNASFDATNEKAIESDIFSNPLPQTISPTA